MIEKWTFTQKELNERARRACDKKIGELYYKQQQQIFAAAAQGEFSITFPRNQVDERYLCWLISFNFRVYVRQASKPWISFVDGHNLDLFDEIQIRW